METKKVEKSGAPGGTRTPDLLVRSQTLYPTELRAHSNEMHCEQFTVIGSRISTLVQPWDPVIRDVRKKFLDQRLPVAPPDDGDTEANDGDSHPAICGDALTQEGFGAESSRGIAQGSDRHDKTYFLKEHNREKREETEAHQRNAQPHPRQAQRSDTEAQNGSGTKVVDFSNTFHGATYA